MYRRRNTHLEVEIVVVDVRDALVDDGTRGGVPIVCHLLGFGSEEARMVPLSADDKRDRRAVRGLTAGCLELLTCSLNLR